MSTPVRGGTCRYDRGCGRFYKALGLCDKHYKAQRRRAAGMAEYTPPRDVPPVCVCDEPTPDVIGQCSQCYRPYRQETFTECRTAWRVYLGFAPDEAHTRCLCCRIESSTLDALIAHRPHCKPSTGAGWPPCSAPVDFAAPAAANGEVGPAAGLPIFESQ